MLDPLQLLDKAFLWLFAFPHWLEYLVIGWVVYGIMVYFKDANQNNWKGTLITCLVIWWLPLFGQLLVWLHTAAVKVFDPTTGPLSAFLNTIKRAWQARIHAKPTGPQIPAAPSAPASPTPGGK